MKRLVVAALAIGCLGILFLAGSFEGAEENREQVRRRDVIVVVLDTLRADHMHYLGYQRGTTPNLDAFAAENLYFEYAVTAAPWTPPSVASILTGLYVHAHGVMPPNKGRKSKAVLYGLSKTLPTIQKLLREAGYMTAAVSPNPWITQEFGFAEGFDRFKYLHRADADVITDHALRILSSRKQPQKPLFLYLHYFDPHSPYDPPKGFRRVFNDTLGSREYAPEVQKLVNLYDGEIRFMDEQLGRLFRYLKERPEHGETIVVIVGDHGEQFYEHGQLGHGHQLHNEELHVPLIIRGGGLRGRREATVSTIDILPTVLELAGVESPGGVHGVSLVDEIPSMQRSGVAAEIRRKITQYGFVTPEGMKLIVEHENDGEAPRPKMAMLYDRRKDYSESAPLDMKEKIAVLRANLKQLRQSAEYFSVPESSEAVEATDETLDQLRSLGYL